MENIWAEMSLKFLLILYRPRKRTTIVTEQIQFSTKPKKGRPKGSGEPKLIQCRLCLKTFTIRSSLIFHVQTVHEGRKDFKCNICDKSFGRPVELKKHKKRHREDFQILRRIILKFCYLLHHKFISFR